MGQLQSKFDELDKFKDEFDELGQLQSKFDKFKDEFVQLHLLKHELD